MQIPTIPPPIITNALPQDITAKVVPNVQAAALLADAVAPPPKGERSNQSRTNNERTEERRKKGDRGEKGKRGSSVNIRV